MIKLFTFYKETVDEGSDWYEYFYLVAMKEYGAVGFRKDVKDYKWSFDVNLSDEEEHWPDSEIIDASQISLEDKRGLVEVFFKEEWEKRI